MALISIMSYIEIIDQQPYISVIIVAHNRKEFLKFAIESVLEQTLEKKLYEIIVIKNFEDQYSDQLIKEKRIIGIKTSNESLVGEDLAIGLETARGEIITFLDDDDTFVKNKLDIIYEIFMKNREIVYYHNLQIFRSSDGSKTPNFKNFQACYDTNYLIIKFKKLVRKYTLGTLLFNISSISIRKSHYVKYVEALKSLANHTDDFFFFIGLNDYGKYYFDKRKLTIYLRHESASKAIQKFDDKNAFLLQKASIQTKGAVASRYILCLVNDDRLKKILMARIDLEELSSNLYVQNYSMVLLLKCLWNSRYYGIKHTILELYVVMKDIMKSNN